MCSMTPTTIHICTHTQVYKIKQNVIVNKIKKILSYLCMYMSMSICACLCADVCSWMIEAGVRSLGSGVTDT